MGHTGIGEPPARRAHRIAPTPHAIDIAMATLTEIRPDAIGRFDFVGCRRSDSRSTMSLTR
jgi:hypothetical protein